MAALNLDLTFPFANLVFSNYPLSLDDALLFRISRNSPDQTVTDKQRFSAISRDCSPIIFEGVTVTSKPLKEG